MKKYKSYCLVTTFLQKEIQFMIALKFAKEK